ncbi:methyl-accepting chemotaxis protein [Paenibacillus sanfengchensis]|uniref:methyl-accepting chemotaxis protein n=1 Tax=Paenibacillus sanfengchensis TaxID=3119819 RepID=UPI002FDFB08D
MKPSITRMTIRKKLYGGFGLVLALLALMSFISYSYLVSVNESYTKLIKEKTAAVQLIKNLSLAVESEHSHVSEFLLTSNQANLDGYNTAQTTFLVSLNELQSLITDRDEKQILAGLDLLQSQYSSVALQMIDAKKQNKTEDFLKAVASQSVVRDKFSNTAFRFVELKQTQLDKEAQATFREVEQIKLIVIGITTATLLVGIIASFLISRAISRPILKLHGMALKIAKGDLRDTQVDIRNSDEIGDLAKSFNDMADNLRALIHEVGLHAHQVADSSGQLSDSAEQTGQATEHVANIMESLAAGTESQTNRITASVTRVRRMDEDAGIISGRASKVAESVQLTSSVAAEGGEAVQTAIDQMSAVQSNVSEVSGLVGLLNERSKEIGDIIAIITDIANQTNLLSLNAAIEAARAGENGRGFAVVASEVRKLSEQTSQSGQKVYEVITAIQTEMDRTMEKVSQSEREALAGIHAVTTAGQSFFRIEAAIHEVSVQIQEVSESSRSMSLETRELVEAYDEINRIAALTAEGTHSVSASAEEQMASVQQIAASSKELSSLAQELWKSIDKFTV